MGEHRISSSLPTLGQTMPKKRSADTNGCMHEGCISARRAVRREVLWKLPPHLLQTTHYMHRAPTQWRSSRLLYSAVPSQDVRAKLACTLPCDRHNRSSSNTTVSVLDLSGLHQGAPGTLLYQESCHARSSGELKI